MALLQQYSETSNRIKQLLCLAIHKQNKSFLEALKMENI